MGQTEDQSPEAPAAEQAQQELLESCLELVFDAFDEAVAEKMVDPVIFLLDCEDEIGEEIAGAWLGAETVSDDGVCSCVSLG